MLFAQYAVSTLFSADVTLIIVQKNINAKQEPVSLLAPAFIILYLISALPYGKVI